MKMKRKSLMVKEHQTSYQIATLHREENQLEPFINKIICSDSEELLKKNTEQLYSSNYNQSSIFWL